ncbi:bacterioferritin [Virgibacillus halotolerans]|uniref:DUF2383 domain-containing protein n=1 Tax=Virgibacillus halotolerans TaxID=1071053 RepID=UPI0019620EFE|nr:DUF2383 domain-containing protein [Virgibacillus halotolerans]MBM7599439.1 bacterioferritin [Virgibacillus halotolerans]
MNEEDVVKELNAYLKGEYMGIHAYEHYIKHTHDPNLKSELQRIQQEHKQHAAKTAERIQNLGGKAVDDNGMKLSISETMMNMKNFPDNNEGIIKEVLKGQEMGMNQATEIIKGDLDHESIQVIKNNSDEDKAHIEQLNQLMQ